jgi:hypothetical protein
MITTGLQCDFLTQEQAMAPPAFAESQLKDEFTPTVNTVIEPYELASAPAEQPPPAPLAPSKAGAPRPYHTTKAEPPPTPCKACPSTMDPAELAGMSFALGAIAGAALVFAFSKAPAVSTDA